MERVLEEHSLLKMVVHQRENEKMLFKMTIFQLKVNFSLALKGRVWSEIKFILKDGRTYPETAAIIFFFEKFVFVVRQVVRPAQKLSVIPSPCVYPNPPPTAVRTMLLSSLSTLHTTQQPHRERREDREDSSVSAQLDDNTTHAWGDIQILI